MCHHVVHPDLSTPVIKKEVSNETQSDEHRHLRASEHRRRHQRLRCGPWHQEGPG